MNVRTLRTLSLPLALAAMFSGIGASTSAIAHAPAATTAQTPRTDVRTACPGLDNALRDSLMRVWMERQQPGLVRVLMQVDGGRVVGVSTVGSHYPYGRPVQRAVQQLDCSAAGDGPQQFSFLVHFTHDADVVTAARDGSTGS